MMLDGPIDKATRFIDALTPTANPVDVEELRRVRLLAVAALFGAGILSATAVTTLLLGLDDRLVALNMAWSALIVATLFVARARRSADFLAHALVTIAFSHTLLLSVLAGGRNLGALFAFSIFPLVAVLVSGWRAGVVFTALSAAAVVLTPQIPLDLLVRGEIDASPVPVALIRDALNVVFAVGFLSAAYDAVRNATLRDTLRARELAEESESRAQLVADRQRQLIEISSRLQDATLETFDAEIARAIELTARLASADRTSLQLFEGGTFAGRFSWGHVAESGNKLPKQYETARKQFHWSTRLVAEGQIAQISSPSALPPEAVAEREHLESRGTLSWLLVPILAGSTMVGYQHFETTGHEKVWDETEYDALRIMAGLIASAVLRHRAMRALIESEKKFAVAFRDHPDSMAITDLETDEILECNEQWLREMAASTREEVIGRTPWEFGFELSADHLTAMRQLLRTAGRTPAVEMPVLGRAGDHRTYLISGTRIDLAGREAVLIHSHDLTTRKQLEQQLLHAQKMEAVGRLAGGVAHDFNNMLTVISGYSSSLIDRLDGEERHSAEEIHAAARRSADLTRQLLAFSRRQMLQTEVLDPNAVLTGLETMLRPLIGESIELRLDLGDAPGRVRSDRGQLEQAIVNLVVNGRDAMPDGGTLTLSTRRTEQQGPGKNALADLEPGAYVSLCVSDEGAGIDPELAEHVMEPFYTTKPEGEGTGLGLPMVHGVARQCGGTLVLRNRPEGGTAAEILLPIVEDEPTTTSSEPLEHDREGGDARHTVLLVEDEPTLRRLASRILRAQGYEVIEAEDGERAFERARELGDAVDILLSDVVMPKLSGIDLVKRLRDERPDLPVVMISGYPEAGGEGSAIPDDVTFLLKPFEPGQLCRALADALREKTEADLPKAD